VDQPLNRSSSTMPPPMRPRWTRRRDWGRVVARVLCAVFAIAGLVPLGLGLLVRTSWARGIAERETQKLLAEQKIEARYELELRLWPLSVALRNVRVEANDGGGPALTAVRASARPKLFGLLAGKVMIDEIDVDRPTVRVVMRDGKLVNLDLELPESDDDTPTRAPFSVVSVSEAEIDLDIDGVHVKAHEIDLDVTTDDDPGGGTAFEIAVRVAQAESRMVRTLSEPEGPAAGEYAVDEDTLCHVDARARIERGRVLVRRFEAHGSADLDPAEETSLGCDLSKDDARYVELAVGHFAIVLPKEDGELPNLDGHVRARAPLALTGRLPGGPDMAGWAMVDAELRYTTDSPLPDAAGRLEVHGFRIDKFHIARSIKSELAVRRSVVSSPLTTVEIAEGTAELRDIEVRPMERGVPLKARLDATSVDFTALMRDLGVSDHPHVAWDLREVRSQSLAGTLNPLRLSGDLVAHTANFAVFDAAVDDPKRTRAIGVQEGSIQGKVLVHEDALEFHNVTVTTPHSLAQGVLVSIGFHEVLRVEVPSAKIDLADLSPLGSIPMQGIAETSAIVHGMFGDPKIEGDASIQGFVLGDLPFGNVTQARVSVNGLVVDLQDVRAQKGKSTFEMPTGRLDFGGAAVMRMDAQITSKKLDLRDFFEVFQLDQDPRLDDIAGTVSTSARMHLALGGPEDVCKGGYLDVQATTDAKDLVLLGERFDEAHADFEYRWVDRMAGIAGADIDVRSLSLTKARREGRGSVGSLLGSLSISRVGKDSPNPLAGGALRGNVVLQGFPIARSDLLGPAARKVEGNVSGVARLGGTLGAWDMEADLNVSPVRILGAPFGGSDLHVAVTQKLGAQKVIGKTPCGLPITAPFDKDAYLRDTSLQGDVRVSGALFGNQVRLDDMVLTREKAPVLKGKVAFAGFDLGPVGRIMLSGDDPQAAVTGPALGGEITGDLTIERLPLTEPARATATFAPKTLRVSRGGQRIELHPGAGPIAIADDALVLPQMTFDLAAPNGFKGAVTLKGGVTRLTRGGVLALDAQLSPIDLGILVGIVPKVTRATGTLSGAVRVTGRAAEPEFEGQLKVRGGELAIKGLPGGITEIEIDAVADENEARITRGTGHFLGGDVGLTARLPLKDGQVGVAQAFLTGRQLSVAPVDGVRATVDADLQVTLNPHATTAAGSLPFVGGEVTITSFEYTRPITIDLTGLRGGARRTTVEAYDPTLDAVTLGFDVRSRVPLRIRNNLIDAQLAIDPRGIHVSGTNQRLGLRGELNTLPGGRFRVFANDFEVQKGTIRFDDPTRIAPHVDIAATTEYRRYTNTVATSGGAANTTGGAGVTAGNISSGGRGGGLWRISLHAYGDTEDLKVDMTSDPALSREDIFFLLTIGLTRAEVDQVQAGSVYASAAFEALGTVTGADRAVKQAIPVIDDFRFGSAYSPRTGRTEPQVTLGRRVAKDVRANVSTGLTEDRQLRSNIEWRLSRPLSVQTSYDNISTVSSGSIGNFGLDFRWRLEFD
jgi:translocation and assembly module TamB